jgi:peptidoglycan/LPS O-acetylase OafA/YrhL
MKTLLYALGSLVMVGAGLGLALLPHLAPTLAMFIPAGAILSALGAGGWLILSASAGDWPRLHSGPVLVAAALVAIGAGIAEMRWQQYGWGGLLLLGGIPLTVAMVRSRRKRNGREQGVFRGPLGR